MGCRIHDHIAAGNRNILNGHILNRFTGSRTHDHRMVGDLAGPRQFYRRSRDRGVFHDRHRFRPDPVGIVPAVRM